MKFILRDGTVEDAKKRLCSLYFMARNIYRVNASRILDKLKLENWIKMLEISQNTIVAVVENNIVGFVVYLEDSNDIASIKPSSEMWPYMS